jgi:hypothetical protein
MSVRTCIVFALLAGCVSEKSPEPAPLQPSVPVSAAPTPPEPTEAQLPIAADFRAEASKTITVETYKTELATLAKELDADEATAP